MIDGELGLGHVLANNSAATGVNGSGKKRQKNTTAAPVKSPGGAARAAGASSDVVAVFTPVPLSSLSSRVLGGPHRRVTQVSAGYFYVAALCGTGEVYTWAGV